MNTRRLRINQLSASATTWYDEYSAALDAKDLDRYGTFLADCVRLEINNADAVHGKPAVLAALGQYWSTFGTLGHAPLNILGRDDAFASKR